MEILAIMSHKILVVDDDADTREMYAEVFREDGFEVLTAHDGTEGFDLATRERPDIIFTGIIMPRMDGFQMVENLRKNAGTADIPVMISSHLGRKEDQLKAREIGIDDFIILGFVPPREVVRIAHSRIEGRRETAYRINVEATSGDAEKITRDFNLPPYLKCSEHTNEQLALELKPDQNQPGGFKARFICPQK